MLASIMTGSIAAAAAARNTVILQGTPGCVGSQSNTAAPKAALTMGQNSAVPGGTVQARSKVPPKNEPAKNHTGPFCPSAQLAPVSSKTGFVAAGMESAHCHQRALHSPDEFPYVLASRGLSLGQWGHGIREQMHLPCPLKTLRGVVVRGQEQSDVGTALCEV